MSQPSVRIAGLKSDNQPKHVLVGSDGRVQVDASALAAGTNKIGTVRQMDAWSITATADNAAATATKAAEAAKSHYITGITGTFSAAVSGKLMTLKDGATVIGNFHVHNQFAHTFPAPIKIAVNTAAELSLAASGTASQIGAVTLTGYTE